MNCGTPALTEANLPNQGGKVFIVTGASGGLGKLLASILFQRHAKVYIATRSEEKANAAITEIANEFPASKGALVYLHLDLNDLSTIKASADEFLAKETRLDVLWNNAGVMIPPEGSKTKQGYESQLGVNTIAPFLFTMYLRDILAATAHEAPANSVRVAWVSSIAATYAPKPAINFDNMNYEKSESMDNKYGRSKAGTCLHAAEFQRRVADQGIVSVSIDPGIHMTDLQRDQSGPRKIMARMLSSPPEHGAYTELFAGLSPEVTKRTSLDGQWVVPTGKLKSIRAEFMDEALGKRYWEWTEDQVRQYL